MPRNGKPPILSRSTPRVARCSTASGISPSPQAPSIGGRPRSRTITDKPARRAKRAVASPIGPPPTMATSATSVTTGDFAGSAMSTYLLAQPEPRVGEAGTGHCAGEMEWGDPVGRSELAREVEAQGLAPPQLARRGTGKRTGREHHRFAHRQAERAEDRLGCGARQRHFLRGRDAATGFDEQEKDLAIPPFRQMAHRDRAAGADARHAVQRALDLLRRVVATAEDHDVLRAAGQEQFALMEESEISGVEPAVAHHARRRFGLIEVAVHQRGAFGPNAAHVPLGSLGAALVLDPDPVAGEGPADSGDLATRAVRSGEPLARERLAVEPDGGEGPAESRKGDRERRFRQAVNGGERLGPEAPAREARGERAHRPRHRRLRAVERGLPGREVDAEELLVADASETEGIAEIRRGRDRRPIARERAQPERGLGDELLRTDQRQRRVAVEGGEDTADQPHVVI